MTRPGGGPFTGHPSHTGISSVINQELIGTRHTSTLTLKEGHAKKHDASTALGLSREKSIRGLGLAVGQSHQRHHGKKPFSDSTAPRRTTPAYEVPVQESRPGPPMRTLARRPSTRDLNSPRTGGGGNYTVEGNLEEEMLHQKLEQAEI
jgi:hypothetical protein